MNEVLVCRHTMIVDQLLNGVKYFRPAKDVPIAMRARDLLPEKTIFIRLTKENIGWNNGWNLIIMSPDGEIALASQYHFYSMNE